MGPLLIILLSVVSSTIQKSVPSNDKASPELETFLENLVKEVQSIYDKDVKIKVDRNKKRSPAATVQYLGELSSEKEGKEGLKGLNKKLAKMIDGLEERVMNEKTKNPSCSCGFVSKRWPGVIKCQCEESSDESDTYRKMEDKLLDNPDKNAQEKPGHTRKIRAMEDRQKYDKLARFNGLDRDCGCHTSMAKNDVRCGCNSLMRLGNDDMDNGYWSDDNWCGCKLLRNDDDDNVLALRCRCKSPGRVGKEGRDDRVGSDDRCGCQLLRNNDDDNDYTVRCGCSSARLGKDNNIDDVYRMDDSRCGCQLLRNNDDDEDFTVRCGCNSPARLGKDDKRDDGYWSDDNWCGCKLLRNIGDDVDMALRCRCNSAARLGKDDNKDDGYWSDDNWCGCKLLRTGKLRCGCNSPARLGKDDNKDDGYWSDDNWCGCKLLRNGKLRCGCNSPARLGKDDKKDDGYWSDDNWCGCKLLRNGKLRCGCKSPARLGNDDNKDDGYWSDDNWCGCKLLRNGKLRCGCNSPARLGKDDKKDDGYWSDDNWCGCKLLRNGKLRCGCKSPERLGDDDNKDDGYWSDDNWCGCKLLRNQDDDNDMKDSLRCRCNSPARLREIDEKLDDYWSDFNYCRCLMLKNNNGKNGLTHYLKCSCKPPGTGRKDDVLDEVGLTTDADTYCGCTLLENKSSKVEKVFKCNCDEVVKASDRTNYGHKDNANDGVVLSEISREVDDKNSRTALDEHSLKKLMNYIIPKGHQHNKKQVKPENVKSTSSGLRDEILSLLDEQESRLRAREDEQMYEPETPLTATQIQTMLKYVEQKNKAREFNTRPSRRNMPEESMGIPFTYELEGLAQVNT